MLCQQGCSDMCHEKQDLLHKYADALNTLLGHLRQQADAVSSGDPDYGRYDGAIEAAERRKKEAAWAYSAHAAHHGCGFPLHVAVDSVRARLNRTGNLRAQDWVQSPCVEPRDQYATIGAGA